MQPQLCSRCKKNIATVFITRMEGDKTVNEGLCLKCAKELGIKPVDDMMKKMGISDDDLDSISGEMMSAFGGMESLSPSEDEDDEDDYDDEPPRKHSSRRTNCCLKNLIRKFYKRRFRSTVNKSSAE